MKQAYFVGGICMMLSFYCNGMELAHEQLVEKLVNNPNTVLQEIKETRKPVDQLFENIKSNLLKTCVVSEWQTGFSDALKNHHTPEHPLLFLDECEGKESINTICLLSRKIKPHYRQQFEDLVTKALTSFKNQPIEYVDFGSGACFQTAVSLTKFLKLRNTAAMNTHLIDLTYYDADQSAQEALAQQWKSLTPEKKEQTAKEYLFNKMAIENLSTFTARAFPLATVNIAKYATAKLYCDKPNQYPDLIVGADITAHKHYATLCSAFPDATNIGLTKGFTKSSTPPYGTFIEYKKDQDEPTATKIPSVVYDNNLCCIT